MSTKQRTKIQPREIIPRNIKDRIYAYQNGTCACCGKKVPFKECTVDHVIPLSKGGVNDESNYAILCFDCNQQKSNLVVAPAKAFPYLPKHMLRELTKTFQEYLGHTDFLSEKCLFKTDAFEFEYMAVTAIRGSVTRIPSRCSMRLLTDNESLDVLRPYLMGKGCKKEMLPSTWKDITVPLYNISSKTGTICHAAIYADTVNGETLYFIDLFPGQILKNLTAKKLLTAGSMLASVIYGTARSLAEEKDGIRITHPTIHMRAPVDEKRALEAICMAGHMTNPVWQATPDGKLPYGNLDAAGITWYMSENSEPAPDAEKLAAIVAENTELFIKRAGAAPSAKNILPEQEKMPENIVGCTLGCYIVSVMIGNMYPGFQREKFLESLRENGIDTETSTPATNEQAAAMGVCCAIELIIQKEGITRMKRRVKHLGEQYNVLYVALDKLYEGWKGHESTGMSHQDLALCANASIKKLLGVTTSYAAKRRSTDLTTHYDNSRECDGCDND